MFIQFPYALLGLLLIPLIILLRLWRLKAITFIVPNLFLWQRIAASLPDPKTYHRKKFILTLLIHCLACAVLILALSSPVLVQHLARGKDVIILLDNSAWMKSLTTKGKTCWTQTKEQLRKSLDTLSPQDSITLFLTVSPTEAVVKGNPKQIKQRLDSLLPLDAPVNWAEYLIKVSSVIAQAEANDLVYLYSNRSPPEEFVKQLKIKPIVVLIGSASNNVGITHLSARPQGKKPAAPAGRYDLLISVSNPTSQTIDTDLELYTDGKLSRQTKLTLRPNKILPVILKALELDNISLIEVKLKIQDGFPLDNTAWLCRSKLSRIKICWLGPENPFVLKALQTNPNLKVEHFTEESFPTDYDLYIYNNLSPHNLNGDNYVVINPPTDFYPIRLRKKTAVKSDITFNYTSPLLKHIRPVDFHIWQGRSIEIQSAEADFFNPIISSSGTPLVAEWHKGKKHLIIFGFDPNWLGATSDTDWALSTAFPIFWANLINYFVSEHDNRKQKGFHYYQTGQPCEINLRDLGFSGKLTSELTLRQPDKTVLTLQSQGDKFTFIPTQVGVYEITRGNKKKLLAVNLAWAEERQRPMRNKRSAVPTAHKGLVEIPAHEVPSLRDQGRSPDLIREVSDNTDESRLRSNLPQLIKEEIKTVRKTFSLIPYLAALGLILFLLAWWIEKSEHR